jgi:hypothetical protein
MAPWTAGLSPEQETADVAVRDDFFEPKDRDSDGRLGNAVDEPRPGSVRHDSDVFFVDMGCRFEFRAMYLRL